ncbi:MAG: phage portal protein [Acidobacteria bacterium]|nr:phage portal protein [Acidobacteriota bacterium]
MTALATSAPYDLTNLIGWRTITGQVVTPATVERVSAVLACLRILSEDLGACPLILRRRTATGNVRATDDPRYGLFHDNFNAHVTAFDAMAAAVWDCLTHGAAFFQKEISPLTGRLAALYPLSASRMAFKDQLSDGTLRWSYSLPNGGARTFLSDELWRFDMLSLAGSADGRALTLLAREAIGLLMAAEEQGARLFSQGIQSNIAFQTAETLDPESRDQVKKALYETYAGSGNAWRALLLENGLTVSKIGLTGQESQYIEARAFQLSDIARIFRIPGVLLGVKETSTYASAEQFYQSYTRNTLLPWCRRIEASIKRDCFAASEADLFVKVSLDHQLRADTKTRFESYQIAVQSGILTRNECRELEDLPQLPGLDAPLTPMNMSPTTQRLAQTVSSIAVAHEQRLLSDGKPVAEIYGRLLPPFLRDKCGLTEQQAATYCQARLAGKGTDALVTILLAPEQNSPAA